MIITRTPFRISFFGGGTDYPDYYREHGGVVLSATINKYCYITCRTLPPFFNHKYHIRYTQREERQTIEEIQHLSVRECLKFVGIKKGLEIVHTSDIPARSGIGSSSSFTVGLLNALYGLQGKMKTKRELATDAIHVEQNLIGEYVGSQDQTATAFGGLNKIEFGDIDDMYVQPITLNQEKLQYLQRSMLFYFTGFSRVASDIAKDKIKRIPNNIGILSEMKGMVNEAINILNGELSFYNEFGKLLHESWTLKKSLASKVSNTDIDDIYERAIDAGALGGKLCGAGGGGFFAFMFGRRTNKR